MVHLSARLMAKALASGILCDEERLRWCDNILDCSVARGVPGAMKDRVVQLCGVARQEISAEDVEDILDEVETWRRWPLHACRLLAEALQWKRALTAGKREDKLIGMELTLDTGKESESLPKQFTMFGALCRK